MSKMLKKLERNSKLWNFGEILDFKYIKFSWKKKHSFAEFFDKISDSYNKKLKNFKNFLTAIGKLNRKKDVKNTKK